MVVWGGCGKFAGSNREIGMCLLIENSEWHKFLGIRSLPRPGIALRNVFRVKVLLLANSEPPESKGRGLCRAPALF